MDPFEAAERAQNFHKPRDSASFDQGVKYLSSSYSSSVIKSKKQMIDSRPDMNALMIYRQMELYGVSDATPPISKTAHSRSSSMN